MDNRYINDIENVLASVQEELPSLCYHIDRVNESLEHNGTCYSMDLEEAFRISQKVFEEEKINEKLNIFNNNIKIEIRNNILSCNGGVLEKRYLHYLLKRWKEIDRLSVWDWRDIAGIEEKFRKWYKVPESDEEYQESREASDLWEKLLWLTENCRSLLHNLALFKNNLLVTINQEFGLYFPRLYKVIYEFETEPGKPDSSFSLENIVRCRAPNLQEIDALFLPLSNEEKGSSEDIIKEMIKTHIEPNKSTNIKLKWSGQKNQLYSVFRQLKAQGLISNTYDELVDFLHTNVVGFEPGQEGTTGRELKREQDLPKSRRVELKVPDLHQE